jgi:hypothetical protein
MTNTRMQIGVTLVSGRRWQLWCRPCLRDCPAWKSRASTCGRALLPHADKHMFVYVLEPCKSEAKRAAKHINKHVLCPHGEEVHARKWKLYAPTQDTAYYMSCSGCRQTLWLAWAITKWTFYCIKRGFDVGCILIRKWILVVISNHYALIRKHRGRPSQ